MRRRRGCRALVSRARALALVASALGVGLAAAACDFSVPDIDTVPEHPTYTADVRPLFDDHCLLCHGSRPSRGAPDDFRLDVYDDTGRTAGARSTADLVLRVVEDDEMPPAAAWGDGVGPNGKELLRRWVAQGAPE